MVVRNRLRQVEIDIQKKIKYMSRMKAHLLICKRHLKDYLRHIQGKDFQDYFDSYNAIIFKIIPNTLVAFWPVS